MDDSPDDGFRLSGRLAPEWCLVLGKGGKTETLEALVELLAPFGKTGLSAAVYAREKLLSAGFGQEIAIPHVRLPTAAGLAAAAAPARGGFPDYESLDSAHQHELYPRVLSLLSSSLEGCDFSGSGVSLRRAPRTL